jgi:16S rRNA G966 N2-methylase RsmD
MNKYPLIISYKDLVRLIDASSFNQVVTDLVHYIKEEDIPYPTANYIYSKEWVKDSARELKKYKPHWERKPYTIRTTEHIPRDLPLTFKGKRWLFVPDESDFERFDVLTNVFTEESRILCERQQEHKRVVSPLYGFLHHTKYLKESLEFALLNCLQDQISLDAHTLREGLYKASKEKDSLVSECANERITFLYSLFKVLIQHLPFRKIRVFDACAGWGDRLLVSAILGLDRYVGIEPNTASTKGFREISKLFSRKQSNGRYAHEVLCDAMPNPRLPKDVQTSMFELVFLSPPSFTSEVYSDDKQQSVMMFPNEEDWKKGFLYPTIDACIELLRPGGFLVIQSILIKMIHPYLLPRLKYVGVISMKTSGKRNKPLWIWTK